MNTMNVFRRKWHLSFKLLTIMGMIALANHAWAGDQFNCVVSGVGTLGDASGWYLQCDGGNRSNAPTCATRTDQWAMSWSGRTDSKETYSLALAVWMAGKPVRISGLGVCDVLSTRETIRTMEGQGM